MSGDGDTKWLKSALAELNSTLGDALTQQSAGDMKWLKSALAELNSTLGDALNQQGDRDISALTQAIQDATAKFQPSASVAPLVTVQPSPVHVEIHERPSAEWEFTPEYYFDGRIKRIVVKRNA